MAATLPHEALRGRHANACIVLSSKWPRRQRQGTVPSYCEAVNYFLEEYETYDVITETNGDMMRFTQLSNKSSTDYAEAL